MNPDLQDQAALYALGLLDPAEVPAFEQRLAADAELRLLVQELQGTVGEMAHAAPAITPPADVRAKIMSAIANRGAIQNRQSHKSAKPEPRLLWNVIGWGLAATLAIGSGLLWNDRNNIRQAERRASLALSQSQAARAELERIYSETQSSLAKATDELKGLRSRDALARMEISTLKSSLQEFQQGVAIVVWDSDKKEGVLKLEKMPPVAPMKDYQLWVIDPKKPAPVDAGVVRVDKDGFARVTFKPVDPIDAAAKFALSVEREGGVPRGEGEIVLISP